jgi:hypothetical protein
VRGAVVVVLLVLQVSTGFEVALDLVVRGAMVFVVFKVLLVIQVSKGFGVVLVFVVLSYRYYW